MSKTFTIARGKVPGKWGSLPQEVRGLKSLYLTPVEKTGASTYPAEALAPALNRKVHEAQGLEGHLPSDSLRVAEQCWNAWKGIRRVWTGSVVQLCGRQQFCTEEEMVNWATKSWDLLVTPRLTPKQSQTNIL